MTDHPEAWITVGLAIVNALQTVALAYLGIVAKRVNGQVKQAMQGPPASPANELPAPPA